MLLSLQRRYYTVSFIISGTLLRLTPHSTKNQSNPPHLHYKASSLSQARVGQARFCIRVRKREREKQTETETDRQSELGMAFSIVYNSEMFYLIHNGLKRK